MSSLPILQQYVVKRMNIRDKEIRQSAEIEVRALCSLDHPNIVKYNEWIERSFEFFIVMEFCEGGDLAKKIDKQKEIGRRFKEEKIIQWTIEMCHALQVSNFTV